MLDVVQEKLDDFLSKQDRLNEAFKKVELGGKLDKSEVYELVKSMPALSKYLKETVDGWTISSENFVKASKENIEAEKREIQSRIETVRSYHETLGMVKALGNQLKYSYEDPMLQAEYDNALQKARGLYGALGITSDDQIDKVFDDLSDELNGLLFLDNLVVDSFDRYKIAIEGINEAYENSKTEIDGYNKKIQTLDETIKKLNEGTLLSYEEMNEIIAIAPKLEPFFEYQDGMYTILTDKIEEWRDKSYQARNEYIDGLIAQTEAEIKAVEAAKEAYQQSLEDLRNTSIGESALSEISELMKDIDGADIQLDLLYDVLRKFQGLRKDITYTDNNKSILDALQNEIDYYKNISSVTVQQAMADLGLSDANDLLKLPSETQKEIMEKLTEAMTAKQNEDNKGTMHKPVTADDILKSLGSPFRLADLGTEYLDNLKQTMYNSAVQTAVNDLKAMSESMVKEVVNNNGNIINSNITINEVKDGKGTAQEVKEILTDLCNKVWVATK